MAPHSTTAHPLGWEGDLPITRVMSPNGDADLTSTGAMLPRGLQLQGATSCTVCLGEMTEIWVCPYCYAYGHPWCLNASILDGRVVCGRCLPEAEAQYRQHLADQEVSRWQQALTNQVAQWKAPW